MISLIRVVESVHATLSYHRFVQRLADTSDSTLSFRFVSLALFLYMRIALYSLVANLLVICTSRRVLLSTNMFMLNLTLCDLACGSSWCWRSTSSGHSVPSSASSTRSCR